ncbi:maleylpyruvate isomerase family mycothiol-dependent enzyme [Streptomyces daliensis]|uniref:Maleylpyruvate isomerase family mycothiol-dependent enzyme n=1 Tax=Streptomyces daliensis TaxID=299421 RepID=A0A8T4IM84_9ACTN|nr:maleylpyruvate isomerase family mycothiol-dependent enzyme [Streptomyces daliensis]
MTSPAHDSALVREATGRLLAATAALGDADVAEPSLLPGWTRGHVLAHLARNADALVEVLGGRPMYADGETRDADIERGAARPLAAHLDDLRHSSARLDGAFAAQRDAVTGAATPAAADWDRAVELRNGVRDTAASLPFRRWIEIELHHVDLGIGYGLQDLPDAFVGRELANLAARFRGHPEIPLPLELRAEGGGHWETGATDAPGGEPFVITGSAVALVGWLTGRTPGTGLSASGPLPTLPPL